MELNIVNEVAALRRLRVGQLRQRFAELFGDTTRASNRTWLTKRILWRMQALAEGDLSQRARQRAAELARDADLRLNAPQNKATTTTPPPQPVRMPTPICASTRPRAKRTRQHLRHGRQACRRRSIRACRRRAPS